MVETYKIIKCDDCFLLPFIPCPCKIKILIEQGEDMEDKISHELNKNNWIVTKSFGRLFHFCKMHRHP